MTMHVMIDLETLGTNSFAVPLSLGAVKFDPMGDLDAEMETFHVYIDPASAVAYGLSMDTGTVMWWLGQDKEAQKMQVDAKRENLLDALKAFSEWFGKESMPVWGNGATFDNVILANAYRAVGLKQPWSYRHDCCFRTLRNLPGVENMELERLGTYHNALHDAMTQAHHMQKIYHRLFGVQDVPGEEIVQETETLCGVND